MYVDLSSVDSKLKQITEAKILPGSEAPSRARQMLATGDVLVSTVRPKLNGVAYVGESFDGSIGSTGFSVLRANPSLLDDRYLFNWVQSQPFVRMLDRQATGASYPAVSDSIVKSSEIPLPPLPEQRRIASVLDRAASQRNSRQRALDAVAAVESAALDLLIGPSGQAVVGTINDVATIQTGPFGSLLHKEDYVSGGVPLINPMHIRDGRLAPDPELSVSEEKMMELKLFELLPNDVVLGRRGEMGRAAPVHASDGRLLCGTGSMILRPIQGAVTGLVLAAMISSAGARAQLAQAAQGVTMLNLNQKIVGSLKVRIPSARSQVAFTELQDQLSKLQGLQRAHLALVDELFASLQHRAFTGQL